MTDREDAAMDPVKTSRAHTPLDCPAADAGGEHLAVGHDPVLASRHRRDRPIARSGLDKPTVENRDPALAPIVVVKLTSLAVADFTGRRLPSGVVEPTTYAVVGATRLVVGRGREHERKDGW